MRIQTTKTGVLDILSGMDQGHWTLKQAMVAYGREGVHGKSGMVQPLQAASVEKEKPREGQGLPKGILSEPPVGVYRTEPPIPGQRKAKGGYAMRIRYRRSIRNLILCVICGIVCAWFPDATTLLWAAVAALCFLDALRDKTYMRDRRFGGYMQWRQY